MTTPEIQALKRELEVALLQAFTDFHRLSGVAVVAVDLSVVEHRYLDRINPDRHLANVTVQLEQI